MRGSGNSRGDQAECLETRKPSRASRAQPLSAVNLDVGDALGPTVEGTKNHRPTRPSNGRGLAR